MKIYSEDGKEFQSVEACEEYENSLKKKHSRNWSPLLRST